MSPGKRMAIVPVTTALGVCAVGVATPPDSALASSPAFVAATEEETTNSYVPLRIHSGVDAVRTQVTLGCPVLAYRFENEEIVGEYAPLTGDSVEEYLREFEKFYGTQPEVVSVMVSIPVSEAEQLSQSVAKAPSEAKTTGDVFYAPSTDPEKISLGLLRFGHV